MLRGLPGPGTIVAQTGWPMCGSMRRPKTDRSTASGVSARCCGPLPAIPFDTDEVVAAVVSPHAQGRVRRQPLFDTTEVSSPGGHDPRTTATRSASSTRARCWPSMSAATRRGQLIVLPDHRRTALALGRRARSTALEQTFDALGPEARQFHLGLGRQPVKTGIHLRRLLGLARLYGATELLSAITEALELDDLRCRGGREPAVGPTATAATPDPHAATPRRREFDR